MQGFLRIGFRYEFLKVGVGAERRGIGFDTDARSHLADAIAIVEVGCQYQRVHSAFAVVVARLQQRCRLAGVH